jgi:PHD/YefM family antitoxin component YafN of YafNO toxin-antitoxin module
MTIATEKITFLEDTGIIEVDVSQVEDSFKEIINRINEEDLRVVLSENGQQKGVIISTEAFLFLERIIEKIEDEIDVANAEKVLAETKPEEYISWEKIKQEREEE